VIPLPDKTRKSRRELSTFVPNFIGYYLDSFKLTILIQGTERQ